MIPQYPQLTATLRFLYDSLQADGRLQGVFGEGVPLISHVLERNPFDAGDDDEIVIGDNQLPCLAMWPTARKTDRTNRGGAADGDEAEFTVFFGFENFHGGPGGQGRELDPQEWAHRVIHNVWWRIRRTLHRDQLDGQADTPEWRKEGGIRGVRAMSCEEFVGDGVAGVFVALTMKYYAPPYELPPPVQLATIKNKLPLEGTSEEIDVDGDFNVKA
jgi:hypothetical protein